MYPESSGPADARLLARPADPIRRWWIAGLALLAGWGAALAALLALASDAQQARILEMAPLPLQLTAVLMAALAARAARRAGEGPDARQELDLAILAALAITGIWWVALPSQADMLHGAADPTTTGAFRSLVGNFVLLVAVASVWVRRRRTGVREPLLWIGLTLTAMVAVDVAGLWLAPVLRPAVALLVQGADALIAVAALAAVGRPVAVRRAPSHDPIDRPERLQPPGAIQWIAVFGVYALLASVLHESGTRREYGVLAGAVMVTLLVLVRHLSLVRAYLDHVTDVAERRGEQRFQMLVQRSSDLLLMVGLDGIVRFASGSVSRILGVTPDSIVGARYLSLVHPEDAPLAVRYLTGVPSGDAPAAPAVWRMRHADGRWLPLETVGARMADAADGSVVLNGRDVSERLALEAELVRQAFHDGLTGLANRALFRDRVAHALAVRARTGVGVAVIFLDLDDFKGVNDTMGHAAGDSLLTQVAERLLNATRGCDTVARLGGDEFAILLEVRVAPDDALIVAQRVLASLTRPVTLVGREVFTPGSLGIALAGADDDADSLLRNADLAMYMAKREGKQRFVVFEPSMHAAALERMEMEADLRRAIEREEFELHYQPIVELDGRRMIAIEALIRWRHPVRGLVQPLAFIPTAEETGMIVPIGRWVLREACRQAAAWRALARPGDPLLTITVNVSARQIQDPGFMYDVTDALRRADLVPEALVLEITESAMVHDTEATLERFLALKALGVLLAVDDFGTGYSSLAYLRRFPVDILKIDKAFIDGVGEGANESVIANAIVTLGTTMSLRTIAEGIEGEPQRARLRELGCELGQGFLFSHPVPAGEVDALLRDRRTPLGASVVR